MCSPNSGNALLVALNSGLPPHAEALDCEDVRGPRSLFGESTRMPRPIGSWNPKDACPEACFINRCYDNCAVLWECRGPMTSFERASFILAGSGAMDAVAGSGAHRFSGCPLDVPSLTYLTGSSTSSFAVAWKLLEDGLLPEWGAVLCSRQTEGRGQLRRAWHSPRGNLYVSFRLPDAPVLKGDAASLVVGWLLVQAFRTLGFPITLKWPNDLMLNEQGKAGGMLLEEKNGVILAGLGVNLAEAPSAGLLRKDHAMPAAILFPNQPEEASGEPHQPDDGAPSMERRAGTPCGSDEPLAPFPLWRLLVSQVILEYSRSVAGNALSDLLGRMDEVLAWKDREVILKEGDGTALSGRFLGLGPGGGLLLRTGHDERRELFSGSLSLAH